MSLSSGSSSSTVPHLPPFRRLSKPATRGIPLLVTLVLDNIDANEELFAAIVVATSCLLSCHCVLSLNPTVCALDMATCNSSLL
eukprot:7077819-Ditylum_brightwellii.AAC.1